jgi:hypothetical protein
MELFGDCECKKPNKLDAMPNHLILMHFQWTSNHKCHKWNQKSDAVPCFLKPDFHSVWHWDCILNTKSIITKLFSISQNVPSPVAQLWAFIAFAKTLLNCWTKSHHTKLLPQKISAWIGQTLNRSNELNAEWFATHFDDQVPRFWYVTQRTMVPINQVPLG